MSKKEKIKQYIKSMVDFLDGRGLVATDDELIDEALEECGEFSAIISICTENSLKDKIKNFLSEFGTEVKEDEDSAYVELMMDNHICVDFEGELFYLQKNCSLYSEDDEIILDYLKACHHV
jgi:hypothetical protein